MKRMTINVKNNITIDFNSTGNIDCYIPSLDRGNLTLCLHQYNEIYVKYYVGMLNYMIFVIDITHRKNNTLNLHLVESHVYLESEDEYVSDNPKEFLTYVNHETSLDDLLGLVECSNTMYEIMRLKNNKLPSAMISRVYCNHKEYHSCVNNQLVPELVRRNFMLGLLANYHKKIGDQVENLNISEMSSLNSLLNDFKIIHDYLNVGK